MGAIDIEADLKSTVEPLTQQGQELPINLNAFSFMPKGPQQQNGQIQQQSAMVAEQAKQQTAQLENQLQIQLVQAKAEMEAKLIQLRGEFELERERIAASGRVESSYVQAKERDTANIRDNKTKLLKENLDGKMGAIDIEADLKSTVEPQTQQGQQLPINLNAFSFMPKGPQQQPQMQQQQPEAAPEQEGPATGIEALEQASA